MKIHSLLSVLMLASLLSSCSSMNSNFSCNVTAGDNCLSMDEVNAMTEVKAIKILPPTHERQKSLIKASVKRLWLVPHADKQGKNHPGEYVYVPEITGEKTA